MPSIDEILYNIKDYSISQLAEFIHQGIINREDVNIPSFAASKRKELDAVLAQLSSAVKEDPTMGVDDEAEWQKAKALDTIQDYSHYLEITDNGLHTEEARQRIDELNSISELDSLPKGKKHYGKNEFERLIEKLSNRPGPSDVQSIRLIKEYLFTNRVDSIINEMRNNPNLLSAGTIQTLYDDDIFSQDQLESIFPIDFLEAMGNGEVAEQPTIQPTQLNIISSPCTEVYFWGISQSGKSCMLAALLSVAKSGKFGLWKPCNCNGYDYMTTLADLMSAGTVTPVAPGTATGTTYDMSFQFITKIESKGLLGKVNTKYYNHPITFIDLAGGMLNLMYKFIANPASLTGADKNKLMNLTRIIGGNRGKNRKIHFFVIEYGAEKYKSQEKVRQDALLTNAAKYIEDERIFDKDTDAIYFVITKADKARKHGKELSDELNRYIDKNYKGFFMMLRDICKVNEITFGVIPFTIGEVMMQSYCRLDPRSASKILQIIMERTFSIDESKIGKIKQGLTE